MSFRAGFVTIIGKPNSGKSTLLNSLLAEKISIVSPKVQTTRHRIKGILTTSDYQIVFSDTPGVIVPKYELHKSMMKSVHESVKDADALLLLLDASKDLIEVGELSDKFGRSSVPSLVAVNKSDTVKADVLDKVKEEAGKAFPASKVIVISALRKLNLDVLLNEIVALLPEHEAFFPQDELTDRSERFIAVELIREKVFEQFHKEIPYHTEVAIQEWKEEKEIIKIRAEVLVERESQKAIVLGKGGSAIKQLGTEARKSIEAFLNKKIFLGLTVKVSPGWRNKDRMLKHFGYES
ncbi:MAG: GTPase Era [Chitinophagales bacterium]|nr:GTPase Era [Chitinophagales bacterium]